MLVEFAVTPLGFEDLRSSVEEMLNVIDAMGIAYRLTPMGVCLEGEWSDVLPVIRLCHARMRCLAPRVETTIRIQDEPGRGQRARAFLEAAHQAAAPSAWDRSD